MKFAAAIGAIFTSVVAFDCACLLAQAPAAKQPTTQSPTNQGASQAGAASGGESANPQFQPLTPAQLAAARAELDAALADFDRWLSQSKANVDFWRPKIGWTELSEELKRGDQARPAAIREVARLFAGNSTGDGSETDALYFYNQFAKVRAALDRYASVLEAAQAPNAGKDWFDARVPQLSEHLTKYRQTLDPSEADKVGEILGQLQDTHEAEGLVARIRQEYGYPNFYAGASAGFISKTGSTPSESLPEPETKPYQDNILGTYVVGTRTTYYDSRTTKVVSGSDHIAMVVDAVGRATSNTVGYHHPVTIYSTGYTPYSASMLVTFDATGFHHCYPTATACVHTNINGICVDGGRLVRRIATRRVYASKGEAEAIASQHASQKAAQEMNEKADDPSDPNSPLRLSQTNYLTKMRYPLLRWGAFPDQTQFSSTPDHVSITARELGHYQLAAPTAPVPVSGTHEMWVSVHQSFINNMASATLAGRTVSEFDSHEAYRNFMGGNKDLDKDLDDANRRKPCDVDGDGAAQPKAAVPENPPKGGAEAAAPPAETAEEKIDRQKHRLTTFAKNQPFTVTFAEGTFTIKIRTTRFSVPKRDLAVRDEDNLPENAQIELPGMDITAVYEIKPCKGGGYMAKQTKYTVEPSDEVRAEWAQRVRGQARRTALMGTSQRQAKRYFARMLPENMEFNGLNFESHTPLARAGKMMPQEVAARDGWLAIGWNFAQ
jgi:hypothetical protein